MITGKTLIGWGYRPTVHRQIRDFRLAEIIDSIEPVGCNMARDWQRSAPLRKRKASVKARQ
jgi:hypothetical protein